MSRADATSELLSAVLQQDVPAIARAITIVESRSPGFEILVEAVWRAGGRAHVIGVTGPPGTGKSTLVASLTASMRANGRTVAIVAIDPSSSRSGGAILGDRIRMGRVAGDDGVFVRSMSTRGALGGVSRATVDAVAVLDAAGWDVVVIETVGVGQSEIDVVQIADTAVVVSVPGLGDEVQSIKAGLLEFADIHVVNKSDRPGAQKTMADLRALLAMEVTPFDGWAPPIVATSAIDGSGTPELIAAVNAHASWLAHSRRGDDRRRRAIEARVYGMWKDFISEDAHRVWGDAFNALIDRVASREVSPHAAARCLVDMPLSGAKGG